MYLGLYHVHTHVYTRLQSNFVEDEYYRWLHLSLCDIWLFAAKGVVVHDLIMYLYMCTCTYKNELVHASPFVNAYTPA